MIDRWAIGVAALLLGMAFPALSEGSGSEMSHAITSQALTLRVAVSHALEESLEARVARLERGRADNALAARRGAYWPQLSLSAQGGYSNRQNEKLTAVDDKNRVREYGLANLGNDPWLTVAFDQVLIDLQQWRELDREVLSAQAAAIAERAGREGVAFEVVKRYAALQRAERETEIARRGIDAAVWLDEQASRLEGAGRVLANGRLQVALARDTASMELQAAEVAQRAARSALWISIDAGPEPARWPGTVPGDLPELGDVAAGEPFDEALRRAPDLEILDLQRQIQEANVAAARAARYPQLKLRGGYAHYGIKRFDQYEDEAFVFLGMELPLFDGFQTSNEVAGARKSASVARLRHRSALVSKRARVEELRGQLAVVVQRLALAGRRADVTAEAQRLSDLQLKSQRGGLAEALVARENSQRDLRAESDLRSRKLELWASLQREFGRLADSIAQAEPAESPPAP